MALVEGLETATVKDLIREAGEARGTHDSALVSTEAVPSIWVSRSPVTVKLRLFCLPYAGGVSENVFSRYNTTQS